MRLTNKTNAPQRRLTLIGVIRLGEFELEPQSYAEFEIGQKTIFNLWSKALRCFLCDFFEIENAHTLSKYAV